MTSDITVTRSFVSAQGHEFRLSEVKHPGFTLVTFQACDMKLISDLTLNPVTSLYDLWPNICVPPKMNRRCWCLIWRRLMSWQGRWGDTVDVVVRHETHSSFFIKKLYIPLKKKRVSLKSHWIISGSWVLNRFCLKSFLIRRQWKVSFSFFYLEMCL